MGQGRMNRTGRNLGRWALPLAALALLGGPAATQDSYGVKHDELVLRYYTPQYVDIDELVDVGQQLFGFNQYVEIGVDEDGDTEYGIVQRFLTLDNSIIVRDSLERAEEIMAKFEEMEAAMHPREAGGSAPEPEGPALESFQYTPRFLQIDQAYEALGSYQRLINVPPPPGGGAYTQVRNISTFNDRPVLLIRETADRIAEMRALLAVVDVPLPQATFTLYLVRGVDGAEEAGDGNLPADVSKALARMLPMGHFETISSAVLRASVQGSIGLNTEADGGETRFSVLMRPVAYDAETGTLTISKLSFKSTEKTYDEIVDASGNTRQSFAGWDKEQSFETSLTLRAGEYTVIGSVGSAPLFVVLRMDV